MTHVCNGRSACLGDENGRRGLQATGGVTARSTSSSPNSSADSAIEPAAWSLTLTKDAAADLEAVRLWRPLGGVPSRSATSANPGPVTLFNPTRVTDTPFTSECLAAVRPRDPPCPSSPVTAAAQLRPPSRPWVGVSAACTEPTGGSEGLCGRSLSAASDSTSASIWLELAWWSEPRRRLEALGVSPREEARDDVPRGLGSGQPPLLLSSLLRRREAAERGLPKPDEPCGLLPAGLSPELEDAPSLWEGGPRALWRAECGLSGSHPSRWQSERPIGAAAAAAASSVVVPSSPPADANQLEGAIAHVRVGMSACRCDENARRLAPAPVADPVAERRRLQAAPAPGGVMARSTSSSPISSGDSA